MKEPIDLDGLFDEKLAEFMTKNAGKYTEKQWESLIPKIYRKFGDTFIPRLGATPKAYYAAMSDSELVETLLAHIDGGVPVPDYLCRELELRRPEGLFDLIGSENVQLATLAVNLSAGDSRAVPAYFTVLEGAGDEELKDAVCDQLKNSADHAKDRALDCYDRGVECERMLEILSRCVVRDDRIFEILLKEFKESAEEIPMHASYLAAYGDERALPVLLEYIDREDINYLEYQELKYAIEALGGEYTKPRDFTEDAYYQEIKSQSQMPAPSSDDGEK